MYLQGYVSEARTVLNALRCIFQVNSAGLLDFSKKLMTLMI